MAITSSSPPPAQAVAIPSSPTSPSASATAEGSPSRPTLSIPLDEKARPSSSGKKEPLLRDSMKTRDALRKGKEGSRRRQRWENDRLLHVPNVQPPLPSDWEVRPTYPVRSIPYYLAPLWDAGVRHRAEEESAAKKAASKTAFPAASQAKGRVPQELRQKLKKARGAKSLLQDLEEEIRSFVKEYELRARKGSAGDELDELDSEDEEIVFVGRNGMSDDDRFVLEEVVEEELEREKLVYESSVGDQGAGFGRYLVHSIAEYYGLSSRSITVGDPARREAYVGIKDLRTGHEVSYPKDDLPRPLWGLI